MINIKSKVRIILIVGVSIAAFAAFGFYNIQNTVKNQARLESIEAIYFPVLERIDATIVSMDQLKDRIERAVVTTDSDLLDESQAILLRTQKLLSELSEYSTTDAANFSKIQKQLSNYHTLATETALGYMNLEMELEEVQSRVTTMNNVYDLMLTGMRGIREDRYSDFIITLQNSRSTAEKLVYFGFAVGVINLLFIWTLAISINKNISMMAIIRQQNEDLEKTVATRTAQLQQKTNDMKVMLANMQQGVFTIKPDLSIHSEFSDYLVDILGTKEIAGKNVIDLLLARSNLPKENIAQIESALVSAINEDLLVYEFNQHLLAPEIQLENTNVTQDKPNDKMIIELDWMPITNEEEKVEKILVIGRDVTKLRALRHEAEQQKKELALICQILEIPQNSFVEFTRACFDSINDIQNLIQNKTKLSLEIIDSIFRKLHTMKGNARTYKFSYLSNTIHNVETFYVQLKSAGSYDVDPAELQTGINEVADTLNLYHRIFEEKLSPIGQQTNNAGEVLQKIKELLADFDNENTSNEDPRLSRIALLIKHWQYRSLSEIITPIQKSATDIAGSLGKATPNIKVFGDSVLVAPNVVQPLTDILMHCVRNAVDHGIETPTQRQTAGKAAEGNITIDTSFVGSNFVLSITDDGLGLNLSRLESLIIEKELVINSPNDEAIANIIFQSGLSAKHDVSEISGRGVGMDAVKSQVEALGGNISVVFTENSRREGTYRHFKLVIELSASYFES